MYYRHFSLSGPPFEAAAGPETLYLSRAHREGLAALEWGLLHEPNGFTTLTGEAGTGKTTLVCSILARNFSQLSAAFVINPKLPFEDILRVVLGQFGVQCTGATKLDRIEALVGFLGRRTMQERLAIIVDEAQDLSEDVLEELRLLSNYGQRIGRYLQLVLVGQPELSLRLKSPSLRQFSQRIAARSVLSRLSLAEAHEYLDHRLRAKGGRSKDIFESHALVHLLRHSDGLPRRINVLCHNAMLAAYSSGTRQVDSKAVRAAVREHGEPLWRGLPALNLPAPWPRPTLVGVAALAMLFAAGYGFKGVTTVAPAVHDNLPVAVVQESKALPAANPQRLVASVSSHVAAPIVPRANAADQPRGALRPSPTTSIFGADKPSTRDASANALPAPLPADLASDREHSGVRQAVGLSTLPPALETNQERSISVKYGDTLEKLALRYLGSRYALNALIDANPQIADINRIYPGQTIYLSAARDSSDNAASAVQPAFPHSASHASDTSSNR